METKQNNELIDCISVVYIKNNTELSEPIGLGVDYDKY